MRQDLPQVSFIVLLAIAEEVRRGRGGREHPGHDVIDGSLGGSLIGHGHRLSRQEPGLPEYPVLTVGRRVANAVPGPPVAAQVLTP